MSLKTVISLTLSIVMILDLNSLGNKKVAWPSGLRRWFKAPVSSEAWVQIPPLPLNFGLQASALRFKPYFLVEYDNIIILQKLPRFHASQW